MRTRFFSFIFIILQLFILSSSRLPRRHRNPPRNPAHRPALRRGHVRLGLAPLRYTNDRGHDAYLALNTATPISTTNQAEWTPTLPITGAYRVEAYIATHPSMDWLCPGKHIG